MSKIFKKTRNASVEVKASFAYMICNIIQKSLSFITLPLFTRILTTTQYGQSTIYSSWSGILAIFITLQLAYGSFSTAMIKFEDDRKGYIASIEGITLVLNAVFLAVYLPFRSFWNKLLELPTVIVIVMVIEILCTNSFNLWTGLKRFEFKHKGVIFVTLLVSFLSPILAYSLVMNTAEKGYARILGYALVNIIVGGILFIIQAFRGKKLYVKKYWKYAFSFNIPLLAYYLSQMIFNQSDRIMISHMVGTDKAAIYGVAYNLAIMLNFVLNSINNSYVPWYYGKLKTGDASANKPVTLAIAVLMAILLSGVIWFAPEIISILAGEKYVEAVQVIPPVAISTLLLFYAQLSINFEFYYERKKSLVYGSLAAAIFNLITNYIFIKRFGFVAAAYTTLASYVLFAVQSYYEARKIRKEKGLENDLNIKGLLILFFAFCMLTVLSNILYHHLVIRILVSAIVLMIVYVKRKYFLSLFSEIKKR